MDRLTRMDYWYACAPGKMLFDLERQQVERLLARIPGQVLLQIGGPSDLGLVKSSTIQHQVYYSLDGSISSGVPSVVGTLEQLPLQAECLDMVVLAHALSCTDQPQRLLDQLYSALRPGGQLLILGFNPWSLWGLTRCLSNQNSFPWAGRFYSQWKVKQYLRLAQYQIVASHSFCYHFPSRRERRWSLNQVSEALGQLLLPACGGVYMILAQKMAAGATPLVDAWGLRRRQSVASEWANPSVNRKISVVANEED